MATQTKLTSLQARPSASGLSTLLQGRNANTDMQLPVGTKTELDQASDMQTPTTTESPTPIEDLISQFQTQAEEARAANEARYTEGKDIYSQIAGMFGPESSYGQSYLQQYDTTKKQALANQLQSLITSGLGNVTTTSNLETAYEGQVGVPFRTQLADLMMSKRAEALGNLAGFIERREDVAPSPELLANLVTQSTAGPETTTGEEETGTTAELTGAGKYFTGGAATDTGAYATGGISSTQYRLEAKRQRIIESKSKQISTLQNRLRTKQKQLSKYNVGDPQHDRLQDQISKLEDQLAEAQDILDENAEPIVESGIFASEQKRRRELQQKKEAEKPVGKVTSTYGAPIMPGFGKGGGFSKF